MDVEKANETNVPEWGQLVDYTKDYGLNGGISPETMMDFTMRYQDDQDLYCQFKWDKSRHYGEKPHGDYKSGAKGDFCSFTSNSSFADKICNSKDSTIVKMDAMDRMIGQWKKVANSNQ